MDRKGSKSLNYYFIRDHIKIKKAAGYRQAVINLLVNKNRNENKDKYLYVQELGGTCSFSRQTVVEQKIVENLFETLVRNLGGELGFKGHKIKEMKPKFYPKAFLFDVARQHYDNIRAKAEAKKKRSTKGKTYHLAIIEYKGPDDLPIPETNGGIADYKWVNPSEARNLLNENFDLLEHSDELSEATLIFHKNFFEFINNLYNNVQFALGSKEHAQQSLFF